MAEELIGRIIKGKYRLLSILGHGGMGIVYCAEHLGPRGSTLRKVALKIMLPRFAANPQFSQRFLREMEVTMQLRHSHIVSVYDADEDEAEQLYYVMELIPGQTLRDILRGPLSIERSLTIVGQICEALSETHGRTEPIIHRDLKPDNIFIEDRQGQDWVKIVDFGLAKVLKESTNGLSDVGGIRGTPLYMAPEQWKDETIDGRTDLYALGVILYEMLTGAPPFLADSLGALMYKHLNEAPPPLPASIPDSIRQQVSLLLRKSRQERPASAQFVRQALAEALVNSSLELASDSDNSGMHQIIEEDLQLNRVPPLSPDEISADRKEEPTPRADVLHEAPISPTAPTRGNSEQKTPQVTEVSTVPRLPAEAVQAPVPTDQEKKSLLHIFPWRSALVVLIILGVILEEKPHFERLYLKSQGFRAQDETETKLTLLEQLWRNYQIASTGRIPSEGCD